MDRRPMGARVPPLPAALPATAAAMPPPRGSRFRSPRPLQPRGGTAPPEPSPARRAPRPGAAPFPAAAAPEPLRRCRPAGRRRRGGKGGRRGREGTPPLRPSCTCRARSIAATRGNTSESFSEQQKAQPWNEPVTQRRREARAQQLLEPASERGPGLLPRFISYFSRGGRPTKNSRRCGAVGRAEQRCFPRSARVGSRSALCASHGAQLRTRSARRGSRSAAATAGAFPSGGAARCVSEGMCGGAKIDSGRKNTYGSAPEPRTLPFCFELRCRSPRTPRPETNTADLSGRKMNAAETKLATAKAALTERGSEPRRDFSHRNRTEINVVSHPSRGRPFGSSYERPFPFRGAAPRRCKRKLRAVPPLRDAVQPQ